MPATDALLIVEGPHDAEFVARLLKAAGYVRVTASQELPEDWRRLVPTTFPKLGRALNRPHEVPQFRRSPAGEIVMTLIAGGDTRLAESLAAGADALGRLPGAIGFVLDDDRSLDPQHRYDRVLGSVRRVMSSAAPDFPPSPGEVRQGEPRAGAYVLPDNRNPGTLEDVLLEAGKVAYPALLEQASRYVDAVELSRLDAEDLKEGHKSAGRKKQTVASVAAILKAGRALATSLQDNRWLVGDALRQPLVAQFRTWLHRLLNLSAI